MEAALKLGVKQIEVIEYSTLVILLSNWEWKVKDLKMKHHQDKLQNLLPKFEAIEFFNIPRDRNLFADAMATLASMIEIPIGIKMSPLLIE